MSNKAGYKNNWFTDWFGQDYLTVYEHRDKDDAASLVNLILHHYPVPAGMRILDVGCGNAWHALQFVKSGAKIIGVDLSRVLLEEASKQNTKSNNIYLVQGDMRLLPFKNGFDGVVNLFTSFGYFSKDEENLLVINEMSRVLKQNGFFVLDYLNADFVRENLISVSNKTQNDLSIKEIRRINKNRVEKEIIIDDGREVKKYYESVRLYEPGDIENMLKQAGIVITAIFGGYQGGAFSSASPRLIISGKKS
ncbi:MAG: class I SAM-dependent methyltransferase [Calditrichaceae bacterium]|nr:class I SAM-dependent methyltransferase [Calditrichaceae bacterium]